MLSSSSLFTGISHIIRPIRSKGNGNKICVLGRRVKSIIRVFGNNNEVMVGEDSLLRDSSITIIGDNSSVIIGRNCKIFGPCSIVLGDNASIRLGNNTNMRGVSINANNGVIQIGENCIFSYGIVIRNNDGHCVVSKDTEQILNSSEDVSIGNHVWVCQNASIRKGVSIGDDSIIAFGSIVTNDCPSNAIMAGNPARVVKRGISWLK